MAKGRLFHSTIISTKGIVMHNVRLLFIVYVIVGKTCYLKTLLYCTQLDCASIGLMHIDEGNAQEKIAQWGVRNLLNTNAFEDTLEFPYNEWNHYSFFILEHHYTLHFDYIPRYHSF